MFYIEEKQTAVVLADSKISKRKKGTPVQVGYPIDWTGPVENVLFNAKVIKFGCKYPFSVYQCLKESRILKKALI